MVGTVNHLNGAGNIAGALASRPEVKKQDAQQPHCTNPLHDHFGARADSYSQECVAQHAHAFTAHNGGPADPHSIAMLVQLLHELKAEIAEMKQHLTGRASHGAEEARKRQHEHDEQVQQEILGLWG